MSIFESMLLNYAYPCQNWTFQHFARAALKNGRNGTNKKSDSRWESNPGPDFSSADAVTAMPRVPVAGPEFLSL